MTGFGRTGKMFACQHEDVIPDYLCLAKGLSGGYMPLAATMVRGEIYNAFLGDADKAFYYGHSYTANQLGCAAGLASLEVFEQEQTLEHLPEKIECLAAQLKELANEELLVYEVRQCGLIAGIELRRGDGQIFDRSHRVGEKVAVMARDYQVLTRPIADTLVVMPPLSISLDEIKLLCRGLGSAVRDYRVTCKI